MQRNNPPKQKPQHPLLQWRNRHVWIQLRSPVSIDGVIAEISGNFLRLQDASIHGTANEYSAMDVWIDMGTIQHWHLA